MNSVENYINALPMDSKPVIEALRMMIMDSYDTLEEKYAYGIIGYYLGKKPILYIGGYKNHIGVYAMPVTHTHFATKLVGYKHGKGSVQFPLNSAIPYDLILEMVEYNIWVK